MRKTESELAENSLLRYSHILNRTISYASVADIPEQQEIGADSSIEGHVTDM